MDCEELNEVVRRVRDHGIASLTNEQIADLLVLVIWGHDRDCDCGECLSEFIEEIW